MKTKQPGIMTRSYVLHVVANVADLVNSRKVAPALMLGDGLAVVGISSAADMHLAASDGRDFYVDQRGGFVDLTPEFRSAGEPTAAWWCPTDMVANVTALQTCLPIAREGHILLQLAGRPGQKGAVRINLFVSVESDVDASPTASVTGQS
ncbi:MAG TPA: hypothetical protein VND64_03040 [Pirellulales bacterium]|nr:hypothetical protein [Pirellulales bacterium]